VFNGKAPKIYEELDGRFTAWSVDPEAPNCWGSGPTQEIALMSYKLRWRYRAVKQVVYKELKA